MNDKTKIFLNRLVLVELVVLTFIVTLLLLRR